MPSELASRSCVPCRGNVQPLAPAEAEHLRSAVPEWILNDEADRIERRFRFPNFGEALAFVEAVAGLAEAEGHHPDICFGWGYANIGLQTKKIKGLHDNDFVMAAKIDCIGRAGSA